MKHYLPIKSLYGEFNLEIPTVCCHCHHGANMELLQTACSQIGGHEYSIYSIWLCPIADCRKLNSVGYNASYTGTLIDIRWKFDNNPKIPKLPARLSMFKSSFLKIYQQAIQAEASGLNELCGMGYRKAVEFLVKDFLIYRIPEKEEEIKKLMFIPVVRQFLSTEGIEGTLRQLLERTAWLGNNQTHYVDYHPGFTILDVKALIQLVVSHIQAILESEFYIKELQPKTKE